MKIIIEESIKSFIKIIISLFKSLISGFTQILWLLLAIILIKTQDKLILSMAIPNLTLFDLFFNTIAKYWLEIGLIISMFYLILNLREMFKVKK